MIKHVVFFKFKPEASSNERREVVDQLRSLPDNIDLIRSWEIGEDIMHSARAWDVVEIATFDDLGALETYTRHDAHVEVVMKLRDICEAVGSVDYEV
jgi:Stress responsive A/B Barrel Domain